jgi:hypothetical protein
MCISRPCARCPASNDEVIVAANDVDALGFDLYRLNMVSSKRTLLTGQRPERTRHWVLRGYAVPLPNCVDSAAHRGAVLRGGVRAVANMDA